MKPETMGRWNVPGLDPDDLLPRSRKYMAENNVHLLDAPEINDNNRLFREACESLGYRVEQFPVNVKGCKGSGLCNLGCPNAAKQGTLRVQLPEAERNGVEVITNCRVERIGERSLEATVEARDFGEPSAWEPGRYRVSAKVIVVAAGAVHSPALLMRSDLPAALPMLGRYFTAHPALILVAQHPRPISNFHGHPKSYICDHFAESDGFMLETCMYFPFVTAKSLSGFGAEHSALMAHMQRLQMILVLAIDPPLADNRVAIDGDGNPVVHYSFSDRVVDAFVASVRTSARIFFAAGAERVHAPIGAKFFIEREEEGRLDELIAREHFKLGKVSIASAHLMGGCRMGAGPEDSVTDAWGQVHGLDWLYVADASLFPRCSEVNPYLTIMGLADRVAERVRTGARELLAA
jgi:choline dehydrogenase-like flavoprotein